MTDLKVSLIQADLHWQDKGANLASFEEKIWKIEDKPDLIILPEMFNSGFTMNAEQVAEPMNLTTFKWMHQIASQTQAVVMGSYVVQEGGHYFNRLLWMPPDGNYDYYDKRHLFRMAGEHEHYIPGNRKMIKDIKGWKIMPLICYDLRFPVWSRNHPLQYDLCIYVANWPDPRHNAWDTLIKARAIENLCYTIGVNRVGKDGNDINYLGGSQIVDFKGNALFHQLETEVIHTQVLEKASLDRYRKKFPIHLDADDFEIADAVHARTGLGLKKTH